jgi:hypothetical protein
MNKIYDTHRDRWGHGQPLPGSSHVFLGPCPICGGRTFDYGGNWRCVGSYCPCSAGNPTPSVGPCPEWWQTDIRVFKDGNAWCAVYESTFENIQESPCGFAATPREAVFALSLELGGANA